MLKSPEIFYSKKGVEMADFNKILVKARFLDENHEMKGREYTFVYKAQRESGGVTARGDYMLIAFPAYMRTFPDGKKVMVTKVFTDPKEVEAYADKLKEVVPYTEGDAEE